MKLPHASSIAKFALLVAGLVCSLLSNASICESGKRQSPTDIRPSRQQSGPSLTFDYRSTDLKIANDGHTVRVRFHNGSVLRIGKDAYTLEQFHFHTPGGDRIEGQEFPMAAHLLHKSKSGKLLAVGVLFRLGAENGLLNALLPIIPKVANGDHPLLAPQIDPTLLLPKDKSYFRYEGSLTAAPCTEGVEWIVLKEPLEISPRQLARYKTLFADNMRTAQPLNMRLVVESN